MKVLLFANTAWYLYNFRRSLAAALRADGYEVVLASPADSYGEELIKLGFRWVPIPMNRRSLNPVRELWLLLWLKRFMKKEEVKLVHSFTLKCAIYGSISARLAGVPARVNAVAGLGYVFTQESLKARSLRLIVSVMLRWALGGRGVKLVLQNPDDMSVFARLKCLSAEHMVLIPGSGVNCDRFKPNPERKRGHPFRVLLPARVLWDKGVGEFLAAASIVRERGGGVEFLIAGEPDPGNPSSVPLETIESWHREGLVTWLGHVTDMAKLFQEVDAVALPSYREGLPKGLIEAGSSGLPLITTDVPGCNQVVQDRKNGLLVPARDCSALAGAVIELRDDAALCSRLGSSSRAHIQENFADQIINLRTKNLFRTVLQSLS